MGSKGDMMMIQHYLEGKLSPGEMHDFEKRALDDPFLADALDGYATTRTDVAQQLSLLQRRLEDRVRRTAEDKNRFYVNWLRLSVAAAAGILFIAAAILFLMKAQPPKPQKQRTPGAVDVRINEELREQYNKRPKPAAVAKEDSSAKQAKTVKPADERSQQNASPVKTRQAARTSDDFENFVGSYPAKKKDAEPVVEESVTLGTSGFITSLSQYKDYLQRAVKPVIDSVGFKGEISVSFLVHPSGEISEVTVSGGREKEIDAVILKAIGSGPKWAKTSGQHYEQFSLGFR
jgi:hypothetical protein